MMVTVVALFAACWAPFHVVHMMVEYSEYLAFSFDDSPVYFLLEQTGMTVKLLLFTGLIKSQALPLVLSYHKSSSSLRGG